MNPSTEPRTTHKKDRLDFEEFTHRFNQRFYDQTFDPFRNEIKKLLEVAWENYQGSHKAPRTQKAGPEFADPSYDLSVEWIETRARIHEAESEFKDRSGPQRVLLITASDRNDQTCPGEISKTSRLATYAEEELRTQGTEVDVLDLSLMTSEFGKVIYPCKGCVSTAMPLCHWPCSCYPNHSLDQVNDWMNEIYPRWVRAHGIMIITPVYWHQAPSALKLMMDRLVCADGGNPDPTTTHGKKAKEAKEIEAKGWAYPRHLEGRVYSVIVHGDATGAEGLRNHLTNWLEEMCLIPAGNSAVLDRYIGYYEPYYNSHEALDGDDDLEKEVRNASKNLHLGIRAMRQRCLDVLHADIPEPRPK